MAVGDKVVSVSSINAAAYLTIQPGSGVEWTIHNIIVPNGKSAELHMYDGSNDILIDTSSTSWLGYVFHLTNSVYLRVKNTDVATQLLGYSGVQTK